MKTKFLLTLLTLTGLCLVTYSAVAATRMPSDISTIDSLSQTISQLIDLDPGNHNLVAAAIDRALLAQGDRDRQPSRRPNVAGGEPVTRPIISGRIAQPKPIQPKPPVFINGTMTVNPPTQAPKK
jgi:hypothetical protein